MLNTSLTNFTVLISGRRKLNTKSQLSKINFMGESYLLCWFSLSTGKCDNKRKPHTSRKKTGLWRDSWSNRHASKKSWWLSLCCWSSPNCKVQFTHNVDKYHNLFTLKFHYQQPQSCYQMLQFSATMLTMSAARHQHHTLKKYHQCGFTIHPFRQLSYCSDMVCLKMAYSFVIATLNRTPNSKNFRIIWLLHTCTVHIQEQRYK